MNPEESQLVVPASFVALFCEAPNRRPNAPREHIAERHELCEDLAQMLCEQALDKRWDIGVSEHEVLLRMRAGLLVEPSVVGADEANWVIARLAELLNWPQLPDAPAPGGSAQRPAR